MDDKEYEIRTGIYQKKKDKIEILPHKNAAFIHHKEYLFQIRTSAHFLKTGESHYKNPY